MRALLDTQIFIILSRQGMESLSTRVQKLLENEDNDLLLSSVSLAEIAIKASMNKLAVTARDVSKATQDLQLTMIPFAPQHAMQMFDLPLHHRDPFDRMLIATALSEGVPIVSDDSEFKRYRGLSVIS